MIYFVVGIGIGGMFLGMGSWLKELGWEVGWDVRVVGVDFVTLVYGGGDGSLYYVEVIGYYCYFDIVDDFWFVNWDCEVVDEVLCVDDRTMMLIVWCFACEEGLLLGGSSVIVVVGMLRVVVDLGFDDVVVVIVLDSGCVYFISDLWFVYDRWVHDLTLELMCVLLMGVLICWLLSALSFSRTV